MSDAAPDDQTAIVDAGTTNDAVAIVDAADGGRAYAAAVMADHPLLYLPFGEPNGSTQAHDATGHFTPGTIGAPTFGRPGAIANDPDTAVLLGQDGFDCGPVFDFAGNQQFTIEVWARVPKDLQVGDPRYLVRKGDFVGDASAPEAYSLYFYAPSVGANAIFTRRVAGVTLSTDPQIDPQIDRFRHLVAVFNGTQLLLFIDAQLIGVDADDRLAGSNTGKFYIGLRQPDRGFVRTEIDELAVYDTALTPERVRAHYDIGAAVVHDP